VSSEKLGRGHQADQIWVLVVVLEINSLGLIGGNPRTIKQPGLENLFS
jgi:hypothetical protein